MRTLKSYVCGRWHEAASGFAPLVNPSTEEILAQASSDGIDFGAVLDHARETGGPELRSLTFAQRGALLKDMSKVLRDHRDELLDLSRQNNGTTKPDGSFDVDGASGTLAYYAALSKSLGDRRALVEGEGVQLARTEGFWAQHVLVPRRGVAVHVNAFNFPAWGFAEKAACALLAGMPVITKPATATALTTERCIELIVAAGILPEGALQLIVGGTGDLLDRLGPHDVLAFTGSADTARKLRHRPHLQKANTRVNVEADSLNAAVLAPDVEVDEASPASSRASFSSLPTIAATATLPKLGIRPWSSVSLRNASIRSSARLTMLDGWPSQIGVPRMRISAARTRRRQRCSRFAPRSSACGSERPCAGSRAR